MSNTVTAENASKKQKSIAQIVLSLIVFAGFVVLLFVRNAATYDKTLFNLVLDVFKGNYTDSLSLKYTLFAFVGSYAILLICTVLSFFTSKRGAAGLNLFKTFIAGGVASAFALLLIRSGKTASEVFYDSATYVALNSTVLMMIFGAVMLLILSIGTYKKAAALKILFVIIAAAFFVFANKLYIRDYTLFDMLGTVSVTGGKADKIAKIVFAAFGWIIVANAALAMLSLCLRKCAAIDYIRTIALFVGVVAGVVMTILYESFGKLFSTSYLGMLSALILTVVQVALLIISTIVKAKRAKAAKAAAEVEEEYTEEYEEEEPAEEYEEYEEEPEQEEYAEEETEYDYEEPAAEQEANKLFEDAAQPIEMPQSDYRSIIRDNETSAHDATAEEPYNYDQAKYSGAFNRQFNDNEQAKNAYYGSAQQQQTTAYSNTAGAYVPDAFLNGLTNAERDEFTRLFISRVYGENRRLPVYRVGEDNREFFIKIFVFMGRYRNIISDSLLEKIYNYSNIIR